MKDDIMIETLLEKPYFVVDFLPCQVPAGSSGQFFAVEQYYLQGPEGADLRRKFSDILLKLNCYYDLLFFPDAEDEGVKNPAPEKIPEWISPDIAVLNVLIESEQTLITYSRDSTNLTVYDPSPPVLDLIRSLAAANGLFVWEPPHPPVLTE